MKLTYGLERWNVGYSVKTCSDHYYICLTNFVVISSWKCTRSRAFYQKEAHNYLPTSERVVNRQLSGESAAILYTVTIVRWRNGMDLWRVGELWMWFIPNNQRTALSERVVPSSGETIHLMLPRAPSLCNMMWKLLV